jgi:hypothetical protein
MTQNGTNFEVEINIGVNLSTGELYANFYSLDPVTGLPPESGVGMLPPEDGTGRGMGWFSYTIEPKPGVATGTEIRNVAHIVFDGQPAIATNQVDPHDPSKGTDPEKEALVTLDAEAPVSSVEPLPGVINTIRFPVSWSADDGNGSGVAGFDVYVAMDGGPFKVWLEGTTSTSAVYTARNGQHLSFYCVAADNAGNKEDPPASPQASTQVTIAPGDINGDGQVDLSDAVLGLKLLARVDTDADQAIAYVDSDGRVGLGEIIFIMRMLSGLR